MDLADPGAVVGDYFFLRVKKTAPNMVPKLAANETPSAMPKNLFFNAKPNAIPIATPIGMPTK